MQAREYAERMAAASEIAKDAIGGTVAATASIEETPAGVGA